jgi:hypothetical protein
LLALLGLAALFYLPGQANADPATPRVTVYTRNYYAAYDLAVAEFLAAQFDNPDSPAYGLITYTLVTTLTTANVPVPSISDLVLPRGTRFLLVPLHPHVLEGPSHVIGGLLGVEHRDIVPGLEKVLLPALESLSVEEGSVGAVQVAQQPAAGPAADLGVLTGDNDGVGAGNDDIVACRTADGGRFAAQLEPGSGQRSGDADQAGNALGLHAGFAGFAHSELAPLYIVAVRRPISVTGQFR